MTNKEKVERNIGLTFDFVTFLVENPKKIENLPDNFILEFVEKDFTKIEKNEKIKSKSKLNPRYVKVINTFEFS